MDEPKQPTVEAFEAALGHYLEEGQTLNDEVTQRLGWFQDAVKASPLFEGSIQGLVDVFLQADDVEGLEAASGKALSPEFILKHKIMMVAAQFFYIGWHARGAIEDADQLKRMTE